MSRLIFKPETHEYWIGTVKVPSVTEVIEQAGLSSSEFYTPESAARGTAVHLATQLLDEGLCTLDEYAGDPILGYLEAWEDFKRVCNVDICEIEKRVYSEFYMVAGTLDRLAMINGKQTVIDIKTGSQSPWHHIQTACYDILLGNAGCRQRMAVYLQPDGKWKVVAHNTLLHFLEAERIMYTHGVAV